MRSEVYMNVTHLAESTKDASRSMKLPDGWRKHNLEVLLRKAQALMIDCALTTGEMLGIWPVKTSFCDYRERGKREGKMREDVYCAV